MKEITKIFGTIKIRCFDKKGEPYFSVLDSCKVLGISNSRDFTATLSKDDVDTVDVIDRLNRNQKLTIINESALYELIFKSRKQEAKAFKKWVTHEVLPSIRKTGKYSIPEKLKLDSIKSRNMLTDSWQDCGVTKKHEFVQLTLQEYKSLDFEKSKRKKDMTKGELLLLAALEAMESLSLFVEPKYGYYECRDNLKKTAISVKDSIKAKELT